MALNYLWIGFFLIAFLLALITWIVSGDSSLFPAMIDSTFEMSKTGFEISLGLTGVLTLWMGIMKIGEKGGIVGVLARLFGPLFRKIFPELGADHKAMSPVMMNVAANMLNLDNAATPMGLQAMKEMQETNPDKERATNAMIMFLVLNTSGLTIIPVSIMVYRAQLGAADPGDVFIPILIATYCSTLAGLISTAIFQKINLFNRVILAYLGAITLAIGGFVWYLSTLPQEQLSLVSRVTGAVILFGLIIGFILLALRRRVNVYEAFIEGAREGFSTAVKIIPFLIAILVGIGVFRASGAMDYLIDGIAWLATQAGLNTDFVPAIPVALMKPLSGSGARGLMVEVMTTHGADSFAGRLASVLQGATDTTFYILAVYFGSVGIKQTRHAVACGLIADLAGIVAAVCVAYLFFGG